MSRTTVRFAAAAVVVAAAVLCLSQFVGNGGSTAYAAVVHQLHNARTLTFSLTTLTGMESMPTVRTDIAFKEPGLMKTTTADGYITVVDATHGDIVKGISLVPPSKSYLLFEFSLTNMPDDPNKNPMGWVEQLRDLPAQAEEFLGRGQIDGRTAEGFRVQQANATTTVWIDTRSRELVRVEVEFADAPGMNTIMSDFQFDIPLDDSLFSMVVPEGYTPFHVQAGPSDVTEKDLIEFLRFWSSWTVDSTFPPTITGTEIAKIAMQMGREGKFVGPVAPGYDSERQTQVMYRGMLFMGYVPAGTWRYAGQNVKYGDPRTPIFWYRPQGSQTYRVIYADLHVADVTSENLPK